MYVTVLHKRAPRFPPERTPRTAESKKKKKWPLSRAWRATFTLASYGIVLILDCQQLSIRVAAQTYDAAGRAVSRRCAVNRARTDPAANSPSHDP